ncbi:hypothetical protein CSKR_103135 [Clonorchis sinensis]|uniref:Choline transporter-like protein n=1 Tax=Clonorchis sinensis TaxID=79923 RepID=A0A8T1MMI6_CLOSI|nr:hypothetical protein CSKR_103135 [Clonorchis sinensis]
MCTDFPFAVTVVSLVIIALSSVVYMLSTGAFSILFENYDCYGNICGMKYNVVPALESVDMSSKKFLMHTNFMNPMYSVPICVRNCTPEKMQSVDTVEQLYLPNDITPCDCRVPASLRGSLPRFGSTPLCVEPPLEPTEIINGVCVPKRFKVDYHEDQHTGLLSSHDSVLLTLNEDIELRWPWLQLILCPTLTFGVSSIVMMLVLCSPTYSIPIFFVLAHFGLLGAFFLLVARAIVHHSLNVRLGWWPGHLFHSLERFGQTLFVLLICTCCIAWFLLLLITIKLWHPKSKWRTVNLSTTQRLLGLISRVLRDLPGLWLLVPLVQILFLVTFLLLVAGNVLLMLTIVEPVKLETTNCISFRLLFWVQYGLIPAFVLYIIWMLRLLFAVFQTIPTVFASAWYHSPAASAPCPLRSVLGGICQRICQQALGSLSLASLLSILVWLPFQVLAVLKVLLVSWPADDLEGLENRKERCTWNMWWRIEHRLRQLESGVFTLIIEEQHSFSKSWTLLNRGFCDHLFSTGLVELVRWPQLMFGLAKMGSALLGTCCGLLYFPVKPPMILGFSAIFLGMFILSYVVASTAISNMQHVLSTILIAFAIEEDEIFARKILNEEVLVGFRHEIIKNLFSESAPHKSDTMNCTENFIAPIKGHSSFQRTRTANRKQRIIQV